MISPIIIIVASATGTVLVLMLAFFLEGWTWGPSQRLPKAHWKRKNPKFPEWTVRAIAGLACLYTLYYLVWRISTLNPQALWLSWLLWGLEAYGFFTFLLFVFMTWRLVYPCKRPTPRNLKVDIFVPTKGESLDILRATLTACIEVKYPHRTVVLDDSQRNEVQALANILGCTYLARTEHKGAKGGNLNFGFKHSSAEFVAVLDADNIPLPDFLEDTLGFFEDNAIAVVQGPQIFYNLDSSQHENSAWHEQRIFYQIIMPGKNRSKSAFWCGSPSILRRKSFDEIGGVAENTVTEDIQTTVRLVKKGYRVIFTEQPLAVGLSPATTQDYLKQRFRWGQGAMQLLRSKDSPVWTPGLSFGQRLSFLASSITYFDGLQVALLLLIPLVTMFTGLMPVAAPGTDFIARFMPYLALIFVGNTMLGRGTYNLLYVQRYSILRAFTFTVALLTFITGKVRPFQVTSKSAGKSADSASWRMIMPHMILIGISLLGLITLVLNFSGMIWYQADPGPMVIAGVWVAINIALLISSAARVFASSFRQQYRFPLKVKLEWRFKGAEAWQPGQTSDMSSGGLSFEYSGFNLRSGDYVEVNISNADNLNNLKASSIEKKGIKLLGRVVNLHNNQGDIRVSGLVIDKFADEASLYNYTLLVHSPAVLLHGEKVFNTEVPDARNLAPVVDGWLATSHNQMKHPGLFLKGSEE